MKYMKFWFVPIFTFAVFFGIASRQAFAKPVNNCESNRCVLCVSRWGSKSTLEDWPAGATLAELQLICASAVSGGQPKRISGTQSPNPPEFHENFALFYDHNLNIAHPWATSPEVNLGASKKAFDNLLPALIDYGFYKDLTVDFPTSYDSRMVSAVADLQKALGFGKPPSATTAVTDLQKALRLGGRPSATPPPPTASGIFTIATRDCFLKFILDLLDANSAAGENIEKFDIVWADGRVSLFTVDLRFSVPSTAFDNIPTASSIPTFIRKDRDRKVYKWDSATKKWNLSASQFPTPKTTILSNPNGNYIVH